MGGLSWAELESSAANVLVEGVNAVSRRAEEANATANSTNATNSLLDDLQFSAAKSIRTSIITLASFNVVAATVTLACVIWDCYLAARRKNANLGIGGLRPKHLGSPQVYPFVLSLGIVAQGIIFAVAQARGLDALLINGCVNISQIMMPATFLVPFLQLILGLEMTIRACLPNPWPQRKNWNVPLCIGITVAGLLALYGVTLSLRPPDQCFASLFWYTQAWRPVCFGLLVGVAGALFIAGIVIFFRLRNHHGFPDSVERLAASQMVYYIVIAVVSNALLTPFFYSITFSDQDGSAEYPMELSTVSSIVANLTGLMTGGLYLFLRGGRKLKDPFNGRNSFEDRRYNQRDEKQAMKDLAGPGHPRRDSSPSVYSEHNESWRHTNAAHESNSTYPYGPGNLIDANNPSFYPTFASQIGGLSAQDKARHSERSSYSIFSQASGSGIPSTTLLPSTTYTRESGQISPASKPDTMLMPPPLFAPSTVGMHNRSSSVGSSATVQIGLRISNMNDMQGRRPSKPYSPRHTGFRSPTPALMPTQPSMAAPRSPLAAPAIPSPSGHSRNESNGNDLNKELPKTPPESPAQAKNEPCQLSPTVYEPAKPPPKARLASPKGVGFQMCPIDRTVKSPVPGASPTEQGNPGWI